MLEIYSYLCPENFEKRINYEITCYIEDVGADSCCRSSLANRFG